VSAHKFTPSNRTGRPSASLAIAGAFFDQFGKHLGNPLPIFRVNNVHEELRVCIEGAGFLSATG
jgi:hypothetical protein